MIALMEEARRDAMASGHKEDAAHAEVILKTARGDRAFALRIRRMADAQGDAFDEMGEV